MIQITPNELRDRLQLPSPPVLLDVREPQEFHYCHLEGSLHIPMQQIPEHIGELENDSEIVVICHHGVRSQHVASFLEQQGFTRVLNLTGGIHAWANDIDPAMPRY
jgi:rhodanese-related sulfurtransferase